MREFINNETNEHVYILEDNNTGEVYFERVPLTTHRVSNGTNIYY